MWLYSRVLLQSQFQLKLSLNFHWPVNKVSWRSSAWNHRWWKDRWLHWSRSLSSTTMLTSWLGMTDFIYQMLAVEGTTQECTGNSQTPRYYRYPFCLSFKRKQLLWQILAEAPQARHYTQMTQKQDSWCSPLLCPRSKGSFQLSGNKTNKKVAVSSERSGVLGLTCRTGKTSTYQEEFPFLLLILYTWRCT